MFRTIVLALVLSVASLVPSPARAADEPTILEAANTAAVRFAAEQQADDEPARRRSMGRTWGGVALIGVGLIMPVQQETCVTLFGVEAGCVTEAYTPGIAAAVGLIGTGVLLATVWSDVPANAIDFGIAPGRVQVGKTFGF